MAPAERARSTEHEVRPWALPVVAAADLYRQFKSLRNYDVTAHSKQQETVRSMAFRILSGGFEFREVD